MARFHYWPAPSKSTHAEYPPEGAARERVRSRWNKSLFPSGATKVMTLLNGLPAAPGTAEGFAWVMHNEGIPTNVPDEAILVARVVHPYLAPLLTRCRGLVVEDGGLLQHAVILAREFGLPAVVGVVDARQQLSASSRLFIDGDRGHVRVIDQR